MLHSIYDPLSRVMVEYLTVKDIFSFCKTDKGHFLIFSDSETWKMLLLRDFDEVSKNPKETYEIIVKGEGYFKNLDIMLDHFGLILFGYCLGDDWSELDKIYLKLYDYIKQEPSQYMQARIISLNRMMRHLFRQKKKFEEMLERLRNPFKKIDPKIADLIISGGTEMYHKLQDKDLLKEFCEENHNYLQDSLNYMLVYSYPHFPDYKSDVMLYAMKRIAPSL